MTPAIKSPTYGQWPTSCRGKTYLLVGLSLFVGTHQTSDLAIQALRKLQKLVRREAASMLIHERCAWPTPLLKNGTLLGGSRGR